MPSDSQHHRNRVGALTRTLGADHPRTTQARTDLAVAKIEAYVERVVADAPPLTEQQRQRLAQLLQPARPRRAEASK